MGPRSSHVVEFAVSNVGGRAPSLFPCTLPERTTSRFWVLVAMGRALPHYTPRASPFRGGEWLVPLFWFA